MSLGARRAPAAREWIGASPHCYILVQGRFLNGIWTYSFHPKSSAAIHHLEEVFVLCTPEPTKPGDFKIRPEMTHVILLAFHGFGVNCWQRSTGWIASEDLFRQGMFVVGIIFWELFWLLWLRLDEHFPQPLGSQVVDSLICRSISENIWHGLLQLLDCDGKPVCLVRFDHP